VAQGAVALAFSQAATQFPCTILVAPRQHDHRSERLRNASVRCRGSDECRRASLLGAQLCNGYGFKDNNRSDFVRDKRWDGIGMQLPLTGGCQCGSVRYQITANPLAVYVCHCTECQRQSGSAFALSLAVAREALVVVEGAPAVWRRELEGGRIIDCLFCGACGVRLFHNRARSMTPHGSSRWDTSGPAARNPGSLFRKPR
jgi:hypothetical protein